MTHALSQTHAPFEVAVCERTVASSDAASCAQTTRSARGALETPQRASTAAFRRGRASPMKGRPLPGCCDAGHLVPTNSERTGIHRAAHGHEVQKRASRGGTGLAHGECGLQHRAAVRSRATDARRRMNRMAAVIPNRLCNSEPKFRGGTRELHTQGCVTDATKLGSEIMHGQIECSGRLVEANPSTHARLSTPAHRKLRATDATISKMAHGAETPWLGARGTFTRGRAYARMLR